jgi:diaminopimelate epimerase
LCDQEITVHMPGGRIEIEMAPDFEISMTGSVTNVAPGTLDPEMLT